MTISGKRLRDAERVVHLLMGTGLLTLAFSPLSDGALGTALRIAVAPLVVLSGLLMWQHGRVTRALRASDGRLPLRIR